jgi:hypothetical protein
MQLPGLSFSDFRADSGKSALPGWLPNPTNLPDIAFNFNVGGGWTRAGGVVPAAALLTTTRASSGYANNSSGNWSLFGNNAPRITNLGLLVEEQRTNSLRNNSMQGAVVGADNVELLTNGNFAAQGAGWTVGQSGAGSAVFSVGQVILTGDGTNGNYIAQLVSGLVVGRSYVVTVGGGASFPNHGVVVGTVPGGTSVLGFTSIVPNGAASNVADRAAFVATAISHWVSIIHPGANSPTITSVSVQDGERCENGAFTFNPVNASQSTVQNGWQWTIGAGTGTVVYNSGPQNVTVTGDGVNAAQITASIPTVAGFVYTVSVDAGGSAATGALSVGTSAFGTQLLNGASVSQTNGQKFQFTAVGATSFITFSKTGATAFTFDNVSVQSAGLLPTNWVLTPVANCAISVAGLGTESGIDYMDVRVAGTTTGALGGTTVVLAEANQQIAASQGQTWASSQFIYLVGGSYTNLTIVGCGSIENNASGTGITSHITNFTNAVGPLGASANRVTNSSTLTNALTAFISQRALQLTTSGAVAIDATFRIGWPQIETTNINSSVASAVIAAAGSGGTNGTAVYQVGGGTGTAATLNVTIAGGVLSAVNSVASAGSYTAFPSSPAALTYVSGTGTGLTGATVTLTQTNNSALGFATSPIRTTAAAAARLADTISTPLTFGAAYSLFAKGTPQAPNTSPNPQTIATVDDGTGNNRSGVRRAATDPYEYFNISGGVSNAGSTVGNWLQNTSNKVAGAFAVSDQIMYGAGAAASAGVGAALPVSPTRSGIGSVAGSQFFNGFVEQVAVWTSQRVPNGQLQSMTT